MSRALLILSLLVAILVGCGSDSETVHGSGDRVTRTFELESFSQIEVSDAFLVRVMVDPAGPQMVIAEIDDILVDQLDIEVSGDRLRIGLKSSFKLRLSDPPSAEITMSELDWMKVSGASDVSVEGAVAARFELDATGASSIELGGEIDELSGDLGGSSELTVAEITGGDVTLKVSGSSRAELSGAANLLVLDVSGASRVEAQELAALNADLQASGASEVRVMVAELAKADASGATTIVISGSAEVQGNTSGSSSIERD